MPGEIRQVFRLTAAGALTTGAKDHYELPLNGEIVNASAIVGTAPTGANLIVDVLKNGVTIFSTAANKPTVAAGATASTNQARPDVPKFVPGDVFSLNVTQIGSTVAGSDLEVTLEYVAE